MANKNEILKEDNFLSLLEGLKLSDKDTGSCKVQVFFLTQKINQLSLHLKDNLNDQSAKRSLILTINQRRKVLSYMKKRKQEDYLEVTQSLRIRVSAK